MKNYLRVLGNRQHQLGIQVSDYQKFESTPLTTLRDFHSEQWNEELASQWRTAYERAIPFMIEGHADDFQVP